MATLKSEVILTMNGQSVINVLEAIKGKAAEVKTQLDGMSPNDKNYKTLLQTYNALNGAQEKIIEDNTRLEHAINNLSSSSIQTLRKALGAGKRDLEKLSEDEFKAAEAIREKMRVVYDQIRYLEGQYVKIEKEMDKLSTKSDAWLEKAISQQKDLVHYTDLDNEKYEEQISLLKKLTDEQNRRKTVAKSVYDSERVTAFQSQVKTASTTLGDRQSMTASTPAQLRSSIDTLKQARDQVTIGGEEWKKYNQQILEAQRFIDELTGKTSSGVEQNIMSVEKLNDVLSNIKSTSLGDLQKASKQLNNDLLNLAPSSEAAKELRMQLAAIDKEIKSVYDSERATAFQSQVKTASAALGNRQSMAASTPAQLRSSIDILKQARDQVTIGGEEWRKYNQQILEAQNFIDELTGKTSSGVEQNVMSVEKLNDVLSNIKSASLGDLQKASKQLNNNLLDLAPSSEAAKELRMQLAAIDKEMKQVEKDAIDVNDVIKRSKQGRASIDELQRAYKKLEGELKTLETGSKAFTDKQKDLESLKKRIDGVTGAVNKQNDSWSTAFKNLTAYVGLFAVFNQLKTLITGVITKNLEMSDSLANIRKVSMLAMNDINKMTESMAKWDTRTPLQELNQIAYAGAKLGIGEYGVEALESFVRASNMVNVALKEDLGEEALTALSKITQVMGLIPKMGVEQSMLKTGSAIFRLASTSTATSGKIIDFSNRLLSMGKQGALATADILALGAAVDSMALEPEVASTAFAKLITEVRKGTSSIEHDLGITSGALKQLFETGRGMDALIMIFEKMHSSGNVFALDKLFKDLGSDGARLVKTMVTMADKVDMLKTAVDTANDAFLEGTAITQEYKIQQETAKGILERANNMWNKAFVNPEGIDMVKQLAQQWYNMSKAMTSSKITITGLKTVLEMLVFSMKTFVSLLPAFVGFFLGRTISQAVIGIGSLVKAVWAAVTAQRALNAAMSANAVGAVVSALAMLVTWLQSLADSEDKAKLGMDKFTKSLKSAKGEVGAAIVELDQYKKAIDSANVGTKQRAAAIKNFNDKFGSYISNLITEKSSVQDIAKAYREASAAIEKKIMAQNKEKDLAQHVAPRADREAQLLYEYDEMAKGGQNAAFNGRWLKAYVDDNLRTKGFHATVTELMKRAGIGTSTDYYRSRNNKAVWNAIYNANGEVGETYKGYKWNQSANRFSSDKDIRYTEEERQTAMAVAYIRQRAAREQALDEVNKKYALYPDFELREDVSPVFIADGDGDKGSKATKTANPNASAQNIAKTRANALISNIKAFYEEQQRKYLEWVVEMNRDGERVSEGQQTAELNAIEQRMNAALGAARQSIATLDSGWQEFLATMDSDIKVQADETSSQLLEAIKSANVTELNNLLGKLSSDLSKENSRSLSENLGALLDEIFAKGSANLRKKAEEQLKHQRSIQRILSSNDYTGSVDRSARSNMETAGLLPKAAAVDATTAEGLSVLNTSFDALTAKTRDYAAELYKINPASATFREDFLAFLSVAKEGFDFTKLKGSELAALYIELARYLEEYSAAQKKEYDNRKKLSDNDWKWKGGDNRQEYVSNTLSEVNNGTYRFRRAAQGEDHTSERSGIMGGNRFIDQFSYNANLESSRAEILLLQEKIEWMKQYKLASSEIAEQEAALAQKQDAYISALMQTMKERMDAIYSLHQPIMDFGTAAGEAFATMTQDAEAGRDALKAAVGDMIKSMMKQTVAMTEEYIKRRMMQKVNDRLVSAQLKKSGKEQEAQEQANNAISTGLQEAAGQAKLDITKDVGNEVVKATVVQNETIASSAAQTAQSEVSSNAAATEANVGLGIASGAAKTIGSLGWWGIPLIAVITAALNALLGFAMGKVSSLFGGGKKKDVATSNVKLTSGMLTYDQGNLQSLPSLRRYQAYDSGNMGELKPFTDTNGKVYWAEEGSIPLSGVSLLTRPTATTVNGQPSIVAENGPELVIGRETTKAMMMNNPDLLRMLLQYNSNHSGRRAYDAGNLPSPSAAPSSLSPEISSLLNDMQQTNTALLRVVGTLTAQLNKPLKAAVDMWGHEGLYESLKKGEQFMKGKG